MTYQLHHGNCIDIMPLIERESVDAVICDPPYGLSFMGKDWDHGVPGMHFWLEALRCAKPGAYLLAFGGTRTFHRLAVAIEDAGWEIRDDIALLASMEEKQFDFFSSLNADQQQAFLDTFAPDKTLLWIQGQGFPKSHDVSKAIDREAGAERTEKAWADRFHDGKDRGVTLRREFSGDFQSGVNGNEITLPATPAAAEWDGWGTALKPAWEPIIVARKPLVGTVAENVQRYGTGAMNVDACRIDIDDTTGRAAVPSAFKDRKGGKHTGYFTGIGGEQMDATGTLYNTKGRWPANLIHDGSAEVLAGFPVTNGPGHYKNPLGDSIVDERTMSNVLSSFDAYKKDERRRIAQYSGDTGSAARFFYCAKASKQDRDEGLEGFEERERFEGGLEGASIPLKGSPMPTARNHHPTVKPTSLMRYLCRLVTPPQGVILDPFMGSGSTGKAAMMEGFNFIGIDTEIEYVEIAARRIEHACEKMGIVVEQPMMFETQRETVDRPKQLILL